jgi:hypothetical protein
MLYLSYLDKLKCPPLPARRKACGFFPDDILLFPARQLQAYFSSGNLISKG